MLASFLFTCILCTFRMMYDLPYTLWSLGWAVMATPLYLYSCTRWNRIERITIFSLVAGVFYLYCKLIFLQEELQKLNDIVFDNAMMQSTDQQIIRTREVMRRIDEKTT